MMELSQSPMAEEDLRKEMERIFNWFQESTVRLEEAYKHLEYKFEQVSLELEQKTVELKEETKRHGLAREHLKILLGEIQPGVVMVDDQGHVIACNPSALSIMNMDPALDLKGKMLEKAFPAHMRDLSALRSCLENPGLLLEEEHWFERPTGALPVQIKYSAVVDHDGVLTGALCTMTDLSPLKKLEEEVQQAKVLSALGEMSATVAHEIRNPLGGIGGYAGLLARQLELTDPRRKLVDKIIGGVSSLNKIVSNLLFYSRKTSLSRHSVNLGAFAEEVLDHVEIEAEKLGKELEIIRDLPVEPVVVSVDPEKLQQVLLNLLINGVQALGESGQIRLSVKSLDAKTVAVEIADNGCGMDSETLAQIFNPFYTTKTQGTGLGLAICKKLVELHGGRIEVESEIGQGTLFRLILI